MHGDVEEEFTQDASDPAGKHVKLNDVGSSYFIPLDLKKNHVFYIAYLFRQNSRSE